VTSKRRSFHLSLSPAAQADIRNILLWSRDKFGLPAAERYRALLTQSLGDIAADPERLGSKKRPEIMAGGVRTYHLRFSRDRAPGPPVQQPRHVVLYREGANGVVEIARILHDSRDLGCHVPDGYKP
jgi:toxin ParE1/3/4